LELAACLKNFHLEGTKDYVVFGLLRMLKGTVNTTGLGIPVQRWMKQVLAAHTLQGRLYGPVFCDKEGVVLTSRDMNVSLHDVLGKLLGKHPTLFLADVKSRCNVEEKYDVFRLFR
jgi:hypothetical protein